MITPRRPLLVALALCVPAALFCACNGSRPAAAAEAPSTQPAAPQVTIDNFTFKPAVLTISPGQTVKWTNKDDVPHTATASVKPREFDSGTLDTDQSWSHTFNMPGTYDYFCAVHPHMTGKIIVK